MGPLSGVSCIECHHLFGGSMAWGVHVHMLLWHLYDLVHIPFWLICPLVRCHLYLRGL